MSEWKYSTIDQSCEILDIYRIPLNEEVRSTKHGVIPYYGANGVQGHIDEYLFDEPLILIAEDGGYFDEYETRPIAYRVYGKSWVNNHAHILRTKPGFGQDYIFYSLVHKNILPYIKGGTRAKLNQNELKQIQIYHPESLDEQLKVSQVLNKVDDVIEKTEAAIDKYQAIKAGMMQDLFTRGIDTQTGKLRPTIEEAPELYKESELGWIPKEWEVNSLKEVSAIEYGASPKSITSNDITNIPIFGSSGNLGYATQSLFNAPLIVVARKGTLNKPTLSNTACWVIDTAYAITPASRINCTWLYYQLDAYDLRRLNESTGVPSISRDYLSRIKLKKPEDTIEQDKIANILMDIDNHILSETISRNKYQSIKQGLMADLLTGKVRVNLNHDKVENR